MFFGVTKMNPWWIKKILFIEFLLWCIMKSVSIKEQSVISPFIYNLPIISSSIKSTLFDPMDPFDLDNTQTYKLLN